MSKEHVNIVSWMATEKDPGRIKYLFDCLTKEHIVDNVFYIYQVGFNNTLDSVRKVLGDVLKPILVELPNYRQDRGLDPWNHKDVYGILKYILPRLSPYKNLYVNISSGTYAIHAAWLILHAGGALPSGTKLIVADAEKQLFNEVDFPITTYLGELRKIENENPRMGIYDAETKSPYRKDFFDKIRAYASVKGVPILLLGERGTGKSNLVASHIKSIKGKEVIPLTCGSLDSTLAESVIFGHKRGSFTGAIAEKKGLLEEAEKKILFLDEIQDLPKSVQRKLLRTLQDKDHRYRMLGDNEEKKADFELVCASNLPENELRERLDPDFFDRISFYKVVIPPLRECREDIRKDWDSTWNTIRVDDAQEDVWDSHLERFLEKSNLQGNFRSLQMIAYQILAWGGKKSNEEILKDLSFENSTNKEFDVANCPEFQNKTWQEATKSFQRKLAEFSCEKYGTQGAAAKKLKCTPKTLQNAMRKESEKE